jgi:hypothetical protein
VLLQILWPLETLSAFTFVGFQGDVHSNMAGDVIALGGLGVAISPGTRQTQVVGRLAANMLIGAVVLNKVSLGPAAEGAHIKIRGIHECLVAVAPLAGELRGRRHFWRRLHCRREASWRSQAVAAEIGKSRIECDGKLENFRESGPKVTLLMLAETSLGLLPLSRRYNSL